MNNIDPIYQISEILSDIEAIENNAEIYEETDFSARADTLDFIEFHIIGRIESLLSAGPNTDLETAKKRIETVKKRLEEIDDRLFKQLRKQLYSGASFKAMVDKYQDVDDSRPGQIGYDNLDVFINALLANQPLPEAAAPREPEMIFYQQTPARVIFEMAERIGQSQSDIFFDIGSGLGQVAILINLLKGIKTVGIEYEPAYCNYATASARALNLPDVKFINTTAQNADYAEGTIFFLYTPFEGQMLQDMLSALEKVSQKRAVRIFTYGPCSPQVARQSWLNCVNGPADDIYVLNEFKSLA